MKTAQIVAGFAIFAGLAIAYNGWANEPPPESALAEVSGQIVQAERVTRTRWSRRNWFPREEYVGHDISVRTEDGGVSTFRILDWEGIPEDRIEGMVDVRIRGRYDPRENVLYELAAGNNVMATYYASSEAQREDSRWALFGGGGLALAATVVLALLMSNRNKAEQV